MHLTITRETVKHFIFTSSPDDDENRHVLVTLEDGMVLAFRIVRTPTSNVRLYLDDAQINMIDELKRRKHRAIERFAEDTMDAATFASFVFMTTPKKQWRSGGFMQLTLGFLDEDLAPTTFRRSLARPSYRLPSPIADMVWGRAR